MIMVPPLLMLCLLRPPTTHPVIPPPPGACSGIFWVAGYETTAHTIGWTLFLIATHPEVVCWRGYCCTCWLVGCALCRADTACLSFGPSSSLPRTWLIRAVSC